MSEPILVTAALPYANGSIHLGHLVEYIMTDVYVRALRMAGEDAIYICADDTHGTPIELNAAKAGVTPEAFIARFAKEHVEDLEAFGVRFDSFYSTNSEENRRWATEIYLKLKEGGFVERREMQQLYDEQAKRFLPDRFVKGICPNCKAPDQYGDTCEVCKRTHEPTQLIDPKSTISGTTPVLRASEHLFVNLKRLQPMLEAWARTPGRVQPETLQFIESWFVGGLKDWCISRDAPYFGFPIPGEVEKYFYVWLDAPVGYIASTENWAKETGQPERVNEIWREGKGRREHVIGKDIMYFHTLFWPAMLHGAGLSVPDRVFVHGMLTVNGEKMSKTRGTFINASTFKKHVDPTYLRYFYASKLGPSPNDLDLSVDEIVNRVNAELVNNLANLVARGTAIVARDLEGRYGKLTLEAAPHMELARGRVKEAEAAYRGFDLAAAARAGMELATLGNKLFQDAEPWKLVRSDKERARDLITLCLNLARAATVILAPAIPAVAERIYPMLGLAGAPARFSEGLAFDLVERPVGAPGHVLPRLEKKQLEAVIEDSLPPEVKAAPKVEAPPAKKEEKKAPPPKKEEAKPPAEIGIDRFLEIDLRVGLVLSAETVEGADALLRLTIDLGEARPRNIFAGIRAAYAPAELVGKKVAVVANLAPRKMRFGVSEGMVLAAAVEGDPDKRRLWLAGLPPDAVPGARIR